MDPQSRGGATPSQPASLYFQNRLDQIWESLMDDEVSLIGVFGMGGIGKTTLAQQIHYRALSHPSTFSSVYWVTAPRLYGVRELQDKFSRAIGLDISFENDEMKRAEMLSRKLALRNEPSGRMLIILDDLWYFVRLQELGIPETLKGCKVIVTSQAFTICREMGCQKMIRVQTITDQEAWDLFLNNLGRADLDLPIEQIARNIARACRGLPIAIVSAARSLRNTIHIQEWEDAYQAITNSNSNGLIRVLKFSYNRLNDLKVQRCFLYCALYLEDYVMKREKLIRLLVAEDLIDGASSEEKLERGHAILDKLIGSALLQEGVEFDLPIVKMDPLIRDMALNIMVVDKNGIGSSSLQNSNRILTDSKDVNSDEWRVTITGTTFYLQVMLEWIFVLTNLILETLSAFFDQISSPKRPQYSLIGMLMSFVALLICIIELSYRIRKERAIWRQCWFYYPNPSNKPLGTFAENFGLICAVSQCLSSTVQYVYFRRHVDNPIKLSIFPVMLAGYLVYLQVIKMR